MQHTETYNLNLIETSDTFSPDPLNQNAQALEDAVEAARAEAQAADSALDARLKVFEAKHFKFGTYKGAGLGTDYPLTVNVGFTPTVVFASTFDGKHSGILYSGYTPNGYQAAKIVPNGFYLTGFSESSPMNTLTQYFYFALG